MTPRETQRQVDSKHKTLAKFAQLWLVIGHLYKPATAARLADGIVAFAGAG
jgi:hypothetical protein